MGVTRLLVANRGEVAVRVIRTARALGVPSVGLHSKDDAKAMHVGLADAVQPLAGEGAAAYLDVDAVLKAARAAECDALHPGYGLLSESPELATACEDSGITFVGPTSETLRWLGDKPRARQLAREQGVAVLPGTAGGVDLQGARQFFDEQGGSPVMVKAVAGGGGRGTRLVHTRDELAEAMQGCASEAQASFGEGSLYLERCAVEARHVEVQVLGDALGECMVLGERECSLQRSRQKVVEFAPCPGLPPTLREQLHASTLRMAREVGYRGAGTFEFLWEPTTGALWFMEANPRLQVEHTVTEEVIGVDLVQAQLQLAAGQPLSALGIPSESRGCAIQLRVNAETVFKDGTVRPSSGTIEQLRLPGGAGVRVDTHAQTGYQPSAHFDSLLAKVVVRHEAQDLPALLRRARAALAELQVQGLDTNTDFLRKLLELPQLEAGEMHTMLVDQQLPNLARSAQAPAPDAGDGEVRCPMLGTVVQVEVQQGDRVQQGQDLVVLSAMKMEHVIESPGAGVVAKVHAQPGQTLVAEAPLLVLQLEDGAGEARTEGTDDVDLDHLRDDLSQVLDRHALGHDAARPSAVARRHGTGHRTARENLEDLIDPGSFREYGPLAIAAQRKRRSLQDLIERTPADGLVGGVATVQGQSCVVMSYDYMVLAGTQGFQNHRKKDRLFELAERSRLPVVFFTEGGGGRPGDTDAPGVAGLDCLAFHYFARLSGLVPLIGIASGRCFAGNAALLGCCDVVIATRDANIGMGGPAMIEGGGLGVFKPEQVGPVSDHIPGGVVDVVVDDEAEAVQVARKYLGYFQGAQAQWDNQDARVLRHLIPENRLRVYDVRRVIETLVDTDSLLTLRDGFGVGMVTALARIHGRPLGILANNPKHLAGAIDAQGADKAARFMQLCDAHDLPILMLCDTPGIMVGPQAESTGLVRHAARMFVTSASLSVPFFTIVLRKGYGLGAQAMAGGSFKAPFFCVGWPTSEFGGMGLEGAVKLGFRKELEAIEDEDARAAAFDNMVAAAYEHGKGSNMASHFEIDDVIDPAASRQWILSALDAAPTPNRSEGKKRLLERRRLFDHRRRSSDKAPTSVDVGPWRHRAFLPRKRGAIEALTLARTVHQPAAWRMKRQRART